MEEEYGIENQEIWKKSFSLGLFVYSLTESSRFEREVELKIVIRKVMVEVLSSVIESFEAAREQDRAELLRKAAVALGKIEKKLLKGYQKDCISFPELGQARGGCRSLRNSLVTVELERESIGPVPSLAGGPGKG